MCFSISFCISSCLFLNAFTFISHSFKSFFVSCNLYSASTCGNHKHDQMLQVIIELIFQAMKAKLFSTTSDARSSSILFFSLLYSAFVSSSTTLCLSRSCRRHFSFYNLGCMKVTSNECRVLYSRCVPLEFFCSFLELE